MQQVTLFPILFYVVAFATILVLYRLSPDEKDGEPGLAIQALIGVIGIAAVWMVVSLVQGFVVSANYFLVTLLHFAILSLVAFRFFHSTSA